MIEADGDVFAIHDPERDYEQRPRQGWATLIRSDAHDTVSDLSRPGVFRLNLGLPRRRYEEVVAGIGSPDYTAFDVVMPHPVYASYGWICVLNPEHAWPAVDSLLHVAHDFAVRRHENRARRRSGDAN